MYRILGRLIVRGWPVFLLLWVGLLVGIVQTAPEWETVAREGEFAFLPEGMPSRRADELLAKAFPQAERGSSVVLVLHRSSGEQLREADFQFIEETLEPRLQQLADALQTEHNSTPQAQGTEPAAPAEDEPPRIAEIRTPGEDLRGRLLRSEDGRAALIVIELTTDYKDLRNREIVQTIEETIGEHRIQDRMPPGLKIAYSGGAMIGRDINRAQEQSADAVINWTVGLVILLLLIVYRAPLLALVPLATLYVAVSVGLHGLALLAERGVVDVFQGLEVYTTVIAYGAGIDYTLFLISRYQEELALGNGFQDAMETSIHKVGRAVMASAGTEIFGIGMLAFAQFGKLHQAGIAITVTLFVVLLAALTFTPPLLLLGRRAIFWPRPRGAQRREPEHPEDASPKGRPLQTTWERLGNLLVRRPIATWSIGVLLLLPLAGGAVRFYNHLSFGLIDQLTREAPGVVGTRIVQRHFPGGAIDPVTVLVRNNRIDFRSQEGLRLLGEWTDRLAGRSDELEIADIRSAADPLGMTGPRPQRTANMQEQAATLREMQFRVMQQQAIERFVSDTPDLDAHVTQLSLVPQQDPYSRESIRNLGEIEDALQAELPAPLREGSELLLAGSTASLRDLKHVAEEDRLRITVLVTVTVFVILVFFLRRVFIPLYLILSVLFSYLVTLGAVFAIFWALDPADFPGLDWTVPIILLTVLVAVGVDYNVFLVTRVEEEQAHRDPVDGVRTALVRTGRIITGCGIIMAGTFAALLVGGEMARMRQLGTALALGMLLDTFVVRPLLVPAFLIVLESGRLGRLGRFLGTAQRARRSSSYARQSKLT